MRTLRFLRNSHLINEHIKDLNESKIEEVMKEEASDTEPDTSVTKETETASKNTTTTCLDPNGPRPYILLARG